jgi:hypothetical protein
VKKFAYLGVVTVPIATKSSVEPAAGSAGPTRQNRQETDHPIVPIVMNEMLSLILSHAVLACSGLVFSQLGPFAAGILFPCSEQAGSRPPKS